ncbi:MAG: HD domain-containing protein [Candidatus Blackburnbacteria bacterium]|nr:HD domain-containing protein [Candidatus Blackburnbacteria bacterium]
MKYIDRVYGNFEIDEPVILELINSKTIQRLKDIDQAGYFEPHFSETAHSRFEHSVGVYLLLKMYGASIEEQIAGLIHDVSHSAFSHCIDYVLDAGSEKEHNYQDNVFDEFVRKSEIPEILRKYGLNIEYILDDKNFPLKEKDLPDLCTDRIDYSLRTAIVFKEIENGKYFIDNLLAENGQWIFKDFESAEKYAKLFLKLNTDYYAGLPSAVMFRTVGDYLRYALSKKYISEIDLYTTDKIVLGKIEPHIKTDSTLSLLFDRMNNKIGFRNNPNDYTRKVFCKSRIVNPLCWHNGKVKRVSYVESSWNGIIERESRPKEYFLKFDK